MGIHQSDSERKPDSCFVPGKLEFLMAGNTGRLLDGRRTPGYVGQVWPEWAMFRWHITGFEDAGRYWDLPAEWVQRMQFEPDSQRLDSTDLEKLKKRISDYSRPLIRDIDPQRREKEIKEIKNRAQKARSWLESNSECIAGGQRLDLESRRGSPALARDLQAYMAEKGLEGLEEKTADIMVLNPSSGEWIKGMAIVAAEMGLTRFRGQVPRLPDIFSGEGCREIRAEYLRDRTGFIQAFFQLQDRQEVALYRGMATEGDFKEIERSFLSCTFSLEVARSFCGLDQEENYRNFYLLKMTVPVSRIFMSYLETEAMNRQYLEAEAHIFYDCPIGI